ncbi:MAG TPA: hypothetical protein VEQ85_08120 [Lacipirellulaceae bacterium]|nr:hypothetical protein [Lacipirellulaceae bacterium]
MALEPTALDYATVDVSLWPQPANEALVMAEAPAPVAGLEARLERPLAAPINEPPTLALALIAVATLAAYRGLQTRFRSSRAPGAKSRGVSGRRTAVKPHARRAA